MSTEERERLLALLTEAREAMQRAGEYEARDAFYEERPDAPWLSQHVALIARIDATLAAEPEARA